LRRTRRSGGSIRTPEARRRNTFWRRKQQIVSAALFRIRDSGGASVAAPRRGRKRNFARMRAQFRESHAAGGVHPNEPSVRKKISACSERIRGDGKVLLSPRIIPR